MCLTRMRGVEHTGELRATGGYIGDYGVLTVQRGRLQPFTLEDIYMLDTPYMARTGWAPALAQLAGRGCHPEVTTGCHDSFRPDAGGAHRADGAAFR